MFDKYLKLLNTIKFLKARQINYRLYYLLRAKFRKAVGFKPMLEKKSKTNLLELQKSIHIINSYLGDNSFNFLNLSKEFKDKIDWNYSGYGKLWTYNLTYFDFLSQDNSREFLFLIEDFIDHIDSIDDGLEPFPISLRGINWIKYLSYYSIRNQKIDDSLYAQYYILMDNLEYHLLGNHLLENGFSVLFGAYYFQDEEFYSKAKEILEEELNEQILDDGGHFELSPMYHQIMLFRVLDLINLVKNSLWKNRELLEFLTQKAEVMLGWIEQISYQNGDIPLLNDSANGIAPTTNQLLDYAKRLNIKSKKLKLSNSGYRKVIKDRYEVIVDIGEVGAKYIAGHAHADTFNFELRIDGKPFIVDTGLSTYEVGTRRDIERSTASHNTVEIDSKNSSEVWGGFRVANRAEVIDTKESQNSIKATHNGYKPILHTREWIFEDKRVIIKDTLNQNINGVARLHFHPDISKEYILEHIKLDNNFEFENYYYSSNFNIKRESLAIIIYFNNFLEIKIDFT